MGERRRGKDIQGKEPVSLNGPEEKRKPRGVARLYLFSEVLSFLFLPLLRERNLLPREGRAIKKGGKCLFPPPIGEEERKYFNS